MHCVPLCPVMTLWALLTMPLPALHALVMLVRLVTGSVVVLMHTGVVAAGVVVGVLAFLGAMVKSLMAAMATATRPTRTIAAVVIVAAATEVCCC